MVNPFSKHYTDSNKNPHDKYGSSCNIGFSKTLRKYLLLLINYNILLTAVATKIKNKSTHGNLCGLELGVML